MSPTKLENRLPTLPDEVWQVGDYPEVINSSVESMNRENHPALLAKLGGKITQLANGITYAQLGENTSGDEVMVMFSPFANGVEDNMLIRGEFIRRVNDASEIVDDQGDPLPLIVFGGSAGKQGFKLTKDQARQLAKDPSFYANEHMKAIKDLGFEKVDLLGFSQGADIALEAGLRAQELELEVGAVALGEPVGVKFRDLSELAKDFSSEKEYLKDDVLASGVRANIKAHKVDLSGWLASASDAAGLVKYGAAVLRQSRTNLALARSMCRETFEYNSAEFLSDNPEASLSVAYGTGSAITPEFSVRRIAKQLKKEFGEDRFSLIAVDGGHHSWGDNLPLLAKFYTEAMQGS